MPTVLVDVGVYLPGTASYHSGMNPYQVADSAREWTFHKKIKLVWTDPPFGTGKTQTQRGQSYDDVSPGEAVDLTERAIERIIPFMRSDGVVCICADYRIIHDVIVRVGSDYLYFAGEVIWTFGLGRPRSSWWPNRHNTIATFTVNQKCPPFDASAVPREIRKAPKPGYEDDKPAGSVWDYTMSNTDPERVGYPNQKPLAIIEPFVLAHTSPGDVVADPFMGSGSTAVAALKHGRRFVGQDLNPKAIEITKRRVSEVG